MDNQNKKDVMFGGVFLAKNDPDKQLTAQNGNAPANTKQAGNKQKKQMPGLIKQDSKKTESKEMTAQKQPEKSLPIIKQPEKNSPAAEQAPGRKTAKPGANQRDEKRNNRGKEKPAPVILPEADRNVLEIFGDEITEYPAAVQGKTQKERNFPKDTLKVIFLGGVGEIGKNMTALMYGNDIIVIDCGLAFPNEDFPGIDLIIPDTTFLQENLSKIRGIFITHGHEDHIGALPFVLKQLDVPVYGSSIALALAGNKLRENNVNNPKLNVVKSKDVIRAGSMSVEYVRVSHSVAESYALCINTPVGVVFHTGDFKVDFTPVDGHQMDLNRIAEIGSKGVLLLLAESTNVERPGYAMSESHVGQSLNGIFAENPDRRIFIATFSSNIHRLQQIIDLAAKFNRRVAFSGRSMLNVVEIATKMGILRIDRNAVIEVEKLDKEPANKVVIITTGSQGEPMSALTRIASGDFNHISVGENDTIIISASPIPGNERLVYNVINNLYRRGARVIYESLAEVHASGHACQEELKLIHSLIKPKFFIPVHGEYRHLKQHAELAKRLGKQPYEIFIPDIGNCVELSKRAMRRSNDVTAGYVLVDGANVGGVGEAILRDRKRLAEEGMLVVVIGINTYNGDISGPDIISRGFVYARNSEELIEETKQVVIRALQKVDFNIRKDFDLAKDHIRKELKNFLFKKLKKSPMILPIILEM